VYWQVVERRASFPGAQLIKLRPDWRDQLSGAQTILDVGAGDRYWKDVLERLGLDVSYQSADVESRHEYDFP
jgi:hypothetical protein